MRTHARNAGENLVWTREVELSELVQQDEAHLGCRALGHHVASEPCATREAAPATGAYRSPTRPTPGTAIACLCRLMGRASPAAVRIVSTLPTTRSLRLPAGYRTGDGVPLALSRGRHTGSGTAAPFACARAATKSRSESRLR
jgi:hypothetical protein